MPSSDELAFVEFEQHFDRLTSLVRERLEVEWTFHRRRDLERLGPELWDLVLEFGRLLRVVYRRRLEKALAREAPWYASVLASRGPGEDAFALLLDSWIVAIQGVIKPPECNVLAAPLHELRTNLPAVFAEARARREAPASPEVSALAERLIAGDLPGAAELVRRWSARDAPMHEAIVRHILPALAEIGRRWEMNEAAIFEEHLATGTAQRLIAGLGAASPRAEPLGRSALVSCVPSEEHEMLPLALSTYLELRGWGVRSLGRGLPGDEIVRAVRALRPDAVFLSLSMASRLDHALALVPQLREDAPRRPILVGGRGAEAGRELLEAAGAKVAQDFDEAHRVASEGGSGDA